MTTGSLCLTLILMSPKPCSSNSDASHSADSTSASGVALPYFCHEPLVQRAGVDADADRDARGARRLGDLLDPAVEFLDVAGVDAHGGAAGVDRGEDVLGLEVDVGDHRNLAVLGDFAQCVGVLLPRAGDPDDVAAGRGQLGDLLQRGVHVVGLGGAHGLHRDRVVAADADVADHELSGLAPRGQRRRGWCRHPETNTTTDMVSPIGTT